MNSFTQTQFVDALINRTEFWAENFSGAEMELFFRYYKLVLKWNPHLHLTTITEPADFVLYNVLESAFVLKNLPSDLNCIYDIGSGAGIPGIPISILNPLLTVNLVEANKKKSVFLKEVIANLNLPTTKALNQRFEQLTHLPHDFTLVSRALDDLPKLTGALMKLGIQGRHIVLLGNSTLFTNASAFIPANWSKTIIPIPQSENRYLISFAKKISFT